MAKNKNRKKEIRRSQKLQAKQKKTSKSSDEIYTVVDNDKTQITNQKLKSDIENTIKQLEFLKVQIVMSLENNQVLSNLEKQIIQDETKNIKELQEKQDLIATDIRKEPIIQRLFPDINYQKTKVFKEIVDKKGTNSGARSWDKKAEDAGLGSEYRFMYSYTSNLSHFASYSIKTSNLISVDEERLLLKRLRVYLYKIVNNLKVFSQLDEVIASMDHEMFNVIELSPEN